MPRNSGYSPKPPARGLQENSHVCCRHCLQDFYYIETLPCSADCHLPILRDFSKPPECLACLAWASLKGTPWSIRAQYNSISREAGEMKNGTSRRKMSLKPASGEAVLRWGRNRANTLNLSHRIRNQSRKLGGEGGDESRSHSLSM